MATSLQNSLSPANPVTLFGENGARILSLSEVRAETVGVKAFGLSLLPAGWVPPFLVIDKFLHQSRRTEVAIQKSLTQTMADSGISVKDVVQVRSSGIDETIELAGQLESTTCRCDAVVATIKNLTSKLPSDKLDKVYWIVQELIEAREKGHLSNERRVKRESRDWLIEFDIRADSPHASGSLAVRKWRDGTVVDLDLRCQLAFEIHRRLKRVAMWAMQFKPRMHFEWVWNGEQVFIVQAQSESAITGTKPHSLLPKHLPEPTIPRLSKFRIAEPDDFNSRRKLKNAALYRKLGYSMPTFYVLDDPAVLRSLLNNEVPEEIRNDLEELTARPLVIRTDGKDIPSDKREMLPRSEGLYSADDAICWLQNTFRNQLVENELLDCELCLIAHSFIPSVAAAWAKATPGHSGVRIESLWGIPEGLYWYSYDTFIVDTLVREIPPASNFDDLSYKIFDHVSFKENFVAPDADGRWVSFHPSPPHQWGKSIQKDRWILEIAHSTRLIAEAERKPLVVMWFIDNHPEATSHKVLPWFHSHADLESNDVVSPRQKYRGVGDFILRTSSDWTELVSTVVEKKVGRVVVNPSDPELIRNPKFARDLGALAKTHGFVVELKGGLLSHAYYMLKKSGATVEVAGLYEGEIETTEFNKLVRDRIPELIYEHGETVETAELRGDALVAALRQKLVEEAFEVLDLTPGSDLLSELVDVEEVLEALYTVLGLTREEIKAERSAKVRKRGGFDRGLLLRKTTADPAASGQFELDRVTQIDLSSTPIISDISDLPSGRVYRRQDLRNTEQGLEKLFTVEVDVNTNLDLRQDVSFSMPLQGKDRGFTLSIDFKRTRSKMRGIVKLRAEPEQLTLDFEY